MPESRSDLLKISPELKSGRMWHDPQNCSFPELEESVSILSKVHPLQPEEKKVRQKTSTVAQMMVQQPENIPVTPGLQPGVLQITTSNSPRGSTAPAPAGSAVGAPARLLQGGPSTEEAPGVGRGSRAPPALTWPVVGGRGQEVSHLCVFQPFRPLHVQSSQQGTTGATKCRHCYPRAP